MVVILGRRWIHKLVYKQNVVVGKMRVNKFLLLWLIVWLGVDGDVLKGVLHAENRTNSSYEITQSSQIAAKKKIKRKKKKVATYEDEGSEPVQSSHDKYSQLLVAFDLLGFVNASAAIIVAETNMDEFNSLGGKLYITTIGGGIGGRYIRYFLESPMRLFLSTQLSYLFFTASGSQTQLISPSLTGGFRYLQVDNFHIGLSVGVGYGLSFFKVGGKSYSSSGFGAVFEWTAGWVFSL